mgnify:CR=1 FL=1
MFLRSFILIIRVYLGLTYKYGEKWQKWGWFQIGGIRYNSHEWVILVQIMYFIPKIIWYGKYRRINLLHRLRRFIPSMSLSIHSILQFAISNFLFEWNWHILRKRPQISIDWFDWKLRYFQNISKTPEFSML